MPRGSAPIPDDINKAVLYSELGYGGSHGPYEEALRSAGLTNPRKRRISRDKCDDVRAILESRFLPVCDRGDCRAKGAQLSDDRAVVPASEPSFCVVCGGSVNRSAVDGMVDVCRRAAWRRLCIVGGSPNTRDELARLVDGRIGLRLIDGTTARRRRQAQADLEWADRVVLWGSTQLDHKVSDLYSGPKVIALARRSISQLAEAVISSAAR